VTAYNWTGFYLGLNAGYGWARSCWDGFAVNTSPSGGMIGVTAGYNWQGMGSPFVFGLEGDIDWANIKGNVVCPAATTCETKTTWFGTFRGRVGYAFDRIMPYVTGGVAFGNIQANRTGFSGASSGNLGWTVGVGLEAAIADRLTGKLEYLYASIGDTNCSIAECGTAANVDLRLNILRAGLNYRF